MRMGFGSGWGWGKRPQNNSGPDWDGYAPFRKAKHFLFPLIAQFTHPLQAALVRVPSTNTRRFLNPPIKIRTRIGKPCVEQRITPRVTWEAARPGQHLARFRMGDDRVGGRSGRRANGTANPYSAERHGLEIRGHAAIDHNGASRKAGFPQSPQNGRRQVLPTWLENKLTFARVVFSEPPSASHLA